jgi:hypothetical protein
MLIERRIINTLVGFAVSGGAALIRRSLLFASLENQRILWTAFLYWTVGLTGLS